jgi:hypothetical protein
MPSIAKYMPEKSRFGFSHNITPEVVSEQSYPRERRYNDAIVHY